MYFLCLLLPLLVAAQNSTYSAPSSPPISSVLLVTPTPVVVSSTSLVVQSPTLTTSTSLAVVTPATTASSTPSPNLQNNAFRQTPASAVLLALAISAFLGAMSVC